MTKKQYSIRTAILILIGIILLFELIRDSMNTGDFIGYVNAGNLVLSHQNIYSDYLNTWPPFFSVFSVVLAIGDKLSSFLIRFIWLLGSIISMYLILSLSIKMVFNKTLKLTKKGEGIPWQEPLVWVPLLILLRFIMDNLANIQINIYMLICTLLAIVLFTRKKFVWAGLLLALTISLKVYTLFFLFYFLFKREYKVVGWTLLFVLLFNLVPFLVFGFEQTVEYYRQWISEVAPRSYIAQHKNQSLFGSFLRFFTLEPLGNTRPVNLLALPAHTVKRMTYAVIALGSLYPAYLFRKKLSDTNSLSSIFEYSFMLTLIPILSPIAWKAYFIFLWFPYFLLYIMLFRVKTRVSETRLMLLRIGYGVSIVLNVFSTELFVGHRFSDVMEAYSCITFGTILLLILQLFVITHRDSFDLSTFKFQHLQSQTEPS